MVPPKGVNLIDVLQNIILSYTKCNILPHSQKREFEKIFLRDILDESIFILASWNNTPWIDLCSLCVRAYPIFTFTKQAKFMDAELLMSPLFSCFVVFCFVFNLNHLKGPAHEAGAQPSGLFSPEPLLGLLCLWQWMKISKWEINGEEAYFTCALEKTLESNSFWWLWL